MFSVLYNQARILYKLEPVAGLLIKSGGDSFDATRPEMEFIRTWAEVNGQVKEVPFLPGSSIKGVIRSHTERILRTLGLIKCDITRDRQACIQGKDDPRYHDHCLACRTFGSTSLASRMRFTDALPWKPYSDGADREAGVQQMHTEQRPGVKIDRRLGTAARRALYEVEVLTEGSFFGEIVVRNYQLWQLALLALVFRDINEGHQRVGAMKSRGLGRVQMAVEEFHIEQFGSLAEPDSMQIRGVGAVEEIVETYDLALDDAIAKPDCIKQENDVLRQRLLPDGVNAQTAWQRLAETIISSEHWQRLLRRKDERG